MLCAKYIRKFPKTQKPNRTLARQKLNRKQNVEECDATQAQSGLCGWHHNHLKLQNETSNCFFTFAHDRKNPHT
jgi:hypothetical protein